QLMSGGSVANSIIAFSQLGGKGGFVGRLGDDKFGTHYRDEFGKLGIKFHGGLSTDQPSGTCVSLVTPDSERTMITSLGASAELGEDSIEKSILQSSEWCFIEGYVIGNPENGHGAVSRVTQFAQECESKIAVTFSAPFIIDVFREQLEDVVNHASMVFANEEEGPLYTGSDSPEAARDALMDVVPHVVVTAGAQGCYIGVKGERFHVPAFSCTPVDLTGAGDMFAGAYLFGILDGMTVEDSASMANFLASRVITQYGARLMQDPLELWKERGATV
ncbi:MAG: adenosine kinase, partial [Bdellovibrionales bacterium]|nr:adenosine kinase [Bdellovibrionales bacterium]